jgi:hypothetical protein
VLPQLDEAAAEGSPFQEDAGRRQQEDADGSAGSHRQAHICQRSSARQMHHGQGDGDHGALILQRRRQPHEQTGKYVVAYPVCGLQPHCRPQGQDKKQRHGHIGAGHGALAYVDDADGQQASGQQTPGAEPAGQQSGGAHGGYGDADADGTGQCQRLLRIPEVA